MNQPSNLKVESTMGSDSSSSGTVATLSCNSNESSAGIESPSKENGVSNGFSCNKGTVTLPEDNSLTYKSDPSFKSPEAHHGDPVCCPESASAAHPSLLPRKSEEEDCSLLAHRPFKKRKTPCADSSDSEESEPTIWLIDRWFRHLQTNKQKIPNPKSSTRKATNL